MPTTTTPPDLLSLLPAGRIEFVPAEPMSEDDTVEHHEKPDALSGAPLLPDFTCDFTRVWDPSY